MGESAVDSASLLFPAEGSVEEDETVAVETMGSGVVYEDGTLKVEVIVLVAPGARLPREQGYAVAHAPALETKTSPEGVGSLTLTPVAFEGPALATITV
jgi:hypothetical protein